MESTPTASVCDCLHEQHTVVTFFVCGRRGHVIMLGWLLALCLCDEHVHCETWEVMSEADSETLHWRAELGQLYDGCLHFLCTNEGRPFVNTSAGKGRVEVCMCIDGVRGGKQKLILAHYANPVDAKEQYVFLTVYRQTHYLRSYSNVNNRHTPL